MLHKFSMNGVNIVMDINSGAVHVVDDVLYEIVDNVVVLNNGKIVKEGNKLSVFSDVDYLDKNNTPVPSIIRVSKMIYDKTGIDLGYQPNINHLVRSINDIKENMVIQNE